MQPGLDGDILAYELGFAAEAGWQQEGFPNFDYVQDILHTRIGNICAMVGATTPPIVYLTGKNNFRYHIAKRTPYKERAGNKPFHYYNIKAYLKSVFDYKLIEGLEADDLLAIDKYADQNNFISCTRDKDDRTVEGWTYSWELGNQPSFGPFKITNPGTLELIATPSGKRIKGTGDLFFYSQCLTGDRVDSIPGLDGCGPVKAFKILENCTNSLEAFDVVRSSYREKYGDTGDEELKEQARLLYMARKFKNNKVLLWNFPEDTHDEWMDIGSGAVERILKD